MSTRVQGTGAWLAARVGKLTASRMAAAVGKRRDGKPSAARQDLMRDLLAERLTGFATEHFVSDAMRWGTEHEPIAMAALEERLGEMIRPCGLFDHPRIDSFAATPDGLRGAHGVVEIKCPSTPKHIEYLRAGVVPDAYRPQVLAQLACTGRTHVTFASFDPRMPSHRQLVVVEWEPDRAEVEAIEAAAAEFLDELEAEFQFIASQPEESQA